MSSTDGGRVKVSVIVTRFMAGAGGVALRGALALDPERYEISFVTGGGRLTDDARALGFDVTVMPDMVPNLSPRHDLHALRLLTELLMARRPDVVHTHSAKAGGLGRMAAHRARVPLVVHTYHGFPFHEFQRPWTRAAYVAAESYLCRRTDVVLTVGSAVAVEAIRRGIVRPAQLRTTAVAIDSDPVVCTPETRAHARDMLGIAADVPVVGTVGRLDYQKAPADFVRAIARLRHVNAIGVWVGDGSLRHDVEQLIDRHGLASRLMLLGDRADVSVLLPAFDVFAMSSRYEGLPCAVVEAMAAGVPVVATAVNAVSDVVLPGETGLLVPPQQPAALASAIDLVLDDPMSAQLRVARAKALLGSRFRPEQLGVILDEVYRLRLPAAVQLSRRVSTPLGVGQASW